MSATGDNFVVFSDDWGRHPSSNQHLFLRLREQARVLWVNTLGLRRAQVNAFTFFRAFEKLREWARPLRQVNPRQWVLAPVMLPVSGEGLLGRLNRRIALASIRRTMRRLGMRRPVLWSTLPTAVDFVGELDERAVVYYVTDDYSLWPGSNARQVREQDLRMTRLADVVFACNRTLAESHGGLREAVLLPHAVDYEHFACCRAGEPTDLAAIPHPRACFFGLVYEKIDLTALAELARRRADLHVVLIGPVATDLAPLAGLANVHVLGARSYAELPAYLAAMDVLLIPYVLDEETRNKGPLKARECLACGKPTVARAIPDLAEMGDVLTLYDDPADLVRAVEAALASACSELTVRMRERVRGESWEARAAMVREELKSDIQGRLPAGRGEAPSDVLRVQTSTVAPDWSQYLPHREQASIYHDAAWGEVMRRAYGNCAHYLTCRRGGRIVGVLQLIEKRSPVFGHYLCSLPYFDSAGLLADDEPARGTLCESAERLRRKLGCTWVELRHLEPLGGLPERTDKVTLLLPLPDEPDRLWKALKAKVRNQVRKAQKADMQTQIGGPELLGEFHAVYARNMRDLGSPPHSLRFFELLVRHFPQAVRLYVVRTGGQAVAASLTLTDRCAARVPWTGSDWRWRDLCPNMLLYWTMLADACGRASVFDFGRSTRECGTFKFKTQWGAAERQLHWEYLLAPGREMPQLRPDSPKYRLMVSLWKRLPVSLVRWAGPWVMGQLS